MEHLLATVVDIVLIEVPLWISGNKKKYLNLKVIIDRHLI